MEFSRYKRQVIDSLVAECSDGHDDLKPLRLEHIGVLSTTKPKRAIRRFLREYESLPDSHKTAELGDDIRNYFFSHPIILRNKDLYVHSSDGIGVNDSLTVAVAVDFNGKYLYLLAHGRVSGLREIIDVYMDELEILLYRLT